MMDVFLHGFTDSFSRYGDMIFDDLIEYGLNIL